MGRLTQPGVKAMKRLEVMLHFAQYGLLFYLDAYVRKPFLHDACTTGRVDAPR
jgi:hypothetical protein